VLGGVLVVRLQVLGEQIQETGSEAMFPKTTEELQAGNDKLQQYTQSCG
jgi:hypothetical protein